MKLSIIVLLSLACVATSSPVQSSNKRLIKTSEEKPGEWMTQAEIWKLIENYENFIDITDYNLPIVQTQEHIDAIPTTLKFQTVVNAALKNIDRARIEAFVRSFSAYHNRYYQSATGEESQQWLATQVQQSLQGFNGQSSVKEVDHGYRQNSIVARIEGSDPTLKSEVVIFGAHLDSLNLRGATLQAPGADDNASGSVTVLETLRVLVQSGIVPKRSVEFHWYAAEEQGLLGSGAIARSYKSSGVNVVGMVNFDVDGYQAPNILDIGIYTDNVNIQLTQFLRLLVDEYLVYGRRDVRCGYGCSDHASWTNNGYPAAFPAEVVFHPQMHTVNDNFANVGFTQVVEFVKLAVGFAVEMAEPSN